MAVELDHVFICVSRGAPEAECLTRFGLIEGPRNVHPGQGTANRRFFFESAMLELLWVEDPCEAQNEQTAATKLWDRWSGRLGGVTSPFGIIMRPVHREDITPPFAAWVYKPDYLPAWTCLHIGHAGIEEPMWVFMPLSRRQAMEIPKHPSGIHQITGITLTSPAPMLARAAEALPILRVESGPTHLLTIEFDRGVRNESVDLRPHLPLILKR
jgi:Glyoxalase-like domain